MRGLMNKVLDIAMGPAIGLFAIAMLGLIAYGSGAVIRWGAAAVCGAGPDVAQFLGIISGLAVAGFTAWWVAEVVED